MEYITECINVPNYGHINDIPWWTTNTQGIFTLKLAWEVLRSKKENKEEY